MSDNHIPNHCASSSHSHPHPPTHSHDESSAYPPAGSSDIGDIYTVLSSYHCYRRLAHLSLTHTRRQTFYALPLSQQNLLSAPPISFLDTLNSLDEAVSNNADLADAIFEVSVDCFGADMEVCRDPRFGKLPNADEMEKVRSTLKQFYRDWSAEGEEERKAAYGPVKDELSRRFGEHSYEEKHSISILVPGAGLARLAFDLAVLGYTCQGNEHSFHQLMASNYILNFSPSANCHTLHPWCHTFSNHRTRSGQLKGVTIPDVHPASLLRSAGDRFSMAAGSFVREYNTPESKATFDVVATVFFIDTAVNVVDYLYTIWNALKPGGVWINTGPLLWHWEGREVVRDPGDEDADGGEKVKGVELTVEEVLVLAEKIGFKVERKGRMDRGEYVGAGEESMLKYVYEGEYWVAVKEGVEKEVKEEENDLFE
ncbi:N2227-domain-containing protein [Ascodesmis nigricans]|uniref:carnosine N-methyltransferase n=1 Tax=Ascodesmis nigricans TaxID=341454 RepID=A0A4S2MYX0_9PEZI|nr:N2227-domain-containing protein [Ascodesmis nigricans]